MTKIFKNNTKGYKVLTPSGFQEFAGISMMGVESLLRLEFEKNAYVECTYNHKFYIDEDNYKKAKDLKVGDTVFSTEGNLKLLEKVNLEHKEAVYDLIEVKNGHKYFTNNILSSNCEFITNDETLINGIVLSELAGEEPLLKMGQVRWYKKPKAPNMYVVALDPSMGTGNDNAAIQVYELPSYDQVAEWQHNMTSIPGQVKILKDICEYISSETKSPNTIYWSVENNGLGEAALIVIQDLGEENIPGMFISEPLRKGHVRKFRRGFNTTFSAKISACSRLKTLVENRQMKIHSKPLVSELKNFVATGSSYNAKTGMDDDLISATLLAIRMMSVLKDWDPRVYDTFKQIENEEDYEPPMPVFISKMM